MYTSGTTRKPNGVLLNHARVTWLNVVPTIISYLLSGPDPRHRAVLEAAAVGIPDEHYGQEILACVVVKPGEACSEDELLAHCLRKLGRYKTPKAIRLVGELPKGPSGKVQRLKLAGQVRWSP